MVDSRDDASRVHVDPSQCQDEIAPIIGRTLPATRTNQDLTPDRTKRGRSLRVRVGESSLSEPRESHHAQIQVLPGLVRRNTSDVRLLLRRSLERTGKAALNCGRSGLSYRSRRYHSDFSLGAPGGDQSGSGQPRWKHHSATCEYTLKVSELSAMNVAGFLRSKLRPTIPNPQVTVIVTPHNISTPLPPLLPPSPQHSPQYRDTPSPKCCVA
jgi:hypothetical protein